MNFPEVTLIIGLLEKTIIVISKSLFILEKNFHPLSSWFILSQCGLLPANSIEILIFLSAGFRKSLKVSNGFV